ncbi:MAG: glycosyltransferase family 39 protein [Acidobacteriota bacterium]|nr:glycosyltransferase family 39 protein [Acidobacteriota bacterium]
MPQVVYIIFGAAFTVAVSWSLGKVLVSAARLKLYRPEEHLFAFMTGAALLSLVVFLCCTVGIARKGVFLWIGIAALIWGWRQGSTAPPFAPLGRPWAILLGAIFTIYAALYICNAMAPEYSPDGSTYHLGLVLRYLKWHGFHRISTNMYANLSQGFEMLFLFAFAFGRHSSAALVHCAFLLALPFLILNYARRFGFARAGIFAALLIFASPMFGIDGVSAYNDVALACVVFTVFYLLQIWLAERSDGLLVSIGLLAGFSYAIKYTAFVSLLYALLLVAWKCRRERIPALRKLILVALPACVMIFPWVAKNWIWLGDPVSPFANSLFPNPFVHVSFEKEYAAYFRNYGLTNLWQVPYLLTVKGSLGGLFGPLFLLAPVGLLALRTTAGRQLLLAALVFCLPYFANIGARFLIPVAPFIALSMGLVLEFSPALVISVLLVHAVLSWPSSIGWYEAKAGSWNLTGLPIRAALRLTPEEVFLTGHSALYGMARVLDRLVPAGKRVLSFDPVGEAYTTRDVFIGYQSAEGNLEQDILYTPLSEESQPTWALDFQFPATALHAIRVVQDASGAPDLWSVSELRIFRNGAELARAPRWRLHAHPYPWDVALAFDNSPVTRWRSWQGIEAGMSIEVDFGGLEPVDRVLVQCTHDQYKIHLHLEGKDESGRWHPLSKGPAPSDMPPMAGLRRMATQELKARGTSYLLIEDSSLFAKDFRVNRTVWGLTLLDSWGQARLYRID